MYGRPSQKKTLSGEIKIMKLKVAHALRQRPAYAYSVNIPQPPPRRTLCIARTTTSSVERSGVVEVELRWS